MAYPADEVDYDHACEKSDEGSRDEPSDDCAFHGGCSGEWLGRHAKLSQLRLATTDRSGDRFIPDAMLLRLFRSQINLLHPAHSVRSERRSHATNFAAPETEAGKERSDVVKGAAMGGWMPVRFLIAGECLFEAELDRLPAQGAEIIFGPTQAGRGIPGGKLVAASQPMGHIRSAISGRSRSG